MLNSHYRALVITLRPFCCVGIKAYLDMPNSIPAVRQTVPFSIIPLSAIPAFRQGTKRREKARNVGMAEPGTIVNWTIKQVFYFVH